MDVYLVPVGDRRFEVYYEAPDDPEPPSTEAPGFFGRVKARFQQQLRDAEHARHHPVPDHPASFAERAQRKMMRWIADRVATQRLLWHLRTADLALLHAPDTMPPAEAEKTMRELVKADGDRHLRRLAIHSVGLLLSIPVAVLPGPNFLGYFFTFTVVGHFLAWRGARRGLSAVEWTIEPSAELTEISHALALEEDARYQHFVDVAGRLHLPRLAMFLQRMTATGA